MSDKTRFDDILDLIESTHSTDGVDDTIYDEELDFAITRSGFNEIALIIKPEISQNSNIENLSISKAEFPQLDSINPEYTVITLNGLDLKDSTESQIAASTLSILCESLSREEDLIDTIKKLYSFFGKRITGSNAQSSVLTGLMGELLAMRYICQTVDDAMKAWHSDPRDSYDFTFTATGEKVEVKSTLSNSRMHRFSGTQISSQQAELAEDTSLNISICSMRLELTTEGEAGDGFYSLPELISEYKKYLPPEQYSKLLAVVSETISADVSDYSRYRYRVIEGGAKKFDLADIPVPAYDPNIITEIKWQARLQEVDGEKLLENSLSSPSATGTD